MKLFLLMLLHHELDFSFNLNVLEEPLSDEEGEVISHPSQNFEIIILVDRLAIPRSMLIYFILTIYHYLT